MHCLDNCGFCFNSIRRLLFSTELLSGFYVSLWFFFLGRLFNIIHHWFCYIMETNNLDSWRHSNVGSGSIICIKGFGLSRNLYSCFLSYSASSILSLLLISGSNQSALSVAHLIHSNFSSVKLL